MKDLQEIVRVFKQAQQENQKVAIATIVNTKGSVYRRPGARMIVTEAGQIAGAISGGCLESDVIEQAQSLLLAGGESKLLQYDSTTSDDLVLGMGSGCNGVVQVLIEPLKTIAAQSLQFIEQCWEHHLAGAIATVFRVEGDLDTRVGDRLLLDAEGKIVQGITDPQLASKLLQDTSQVLSTGKNQVKSYPLNGGSAEVLIEVIQPPVSLLVFGAGYDAIPVVTFAKQLGWQVTVIDHRPAYATCDRFPTADKIIVSRPGDLLGQISLTPQTVAVVMTHHYLYDQTLLQILLPSPVPYVGLLGPKHRSQQLLKDYQAEGLSFTKEQLHRLYAPVGLDIGAETPEEIALAIVAEIQSALNHYSGGNLRQRTGPIHGEDRTCLTLV